FISHILICDSSMLLIYLPSFPTRRSSDLTAALRRSLRTISTCSRRPDPTSSSLPLPITGTRRCSSTRFAPDATSIARNHSHSPRSEEHTSELQSRENLVCRLLLDKKNIHH